MSRLYPPIVVCSIMIFVYGLGCAQNLQGMDGSEFMLVGSQGGRLHPSGYPIAVYIMHLLQWIPIDNPAYTTSFFSVLFGTLALGVQSLSIHKLTKEPVLSIVLPILLGFSPLWLRYCTVAEVFASAAFAVSCLVCLAIYVYQKDIEGSRVGIFLGILGGFAFANHHSFAFAWPLIFWIMWKGKTGYTGILYTIVFGLWGVIAYIPLLYAKGPWIWGNFDDLWGLLGHIFRREYGTFTLRAGETTALWYENPLFYLKLLPEEFLIWPLAFLPLAFFRKEQFEFTAILFCTWLSTAIFFLGLFNISPVGEASVIAQRFMVAPSILLLPIMAIGMKNWMNHSIFRIVISLLTLLPFYLYVGNIEHGKDRRMEDFLRNACSVTPKNSIVFVRGDGITFGLIYAQEVLQICQQITPISPSLLKLKWYATWLKNRYPDIDLSDISLPQIITNNPNHQYFASIGLLGDQELQSILPPFRPYKAVWVQFLTTQNTKPLPSPFELEQEYWESIAAFELPIENSHPFFIQRTAEVWATNQYAISLQVIASGYMSFGYPEEVLRLNQMAQYILDGDWEHFWKIRTENHIK